MSRVVRMLLVTTVGALGLGALAGPASAGIWSEIPSGTASTITAIEYQSDTRFWFTTSSGEIWKRKPDLSGFQQVRPASAIALNDIEFQADGQIGLAVGDGGQVLRSTTGGDSWGTVPGIPVSNVGDGSGNKCTFSVPLGDVNFVRFAGNGRAWIGADGRQLATSQPANAANVGATGTWTDANRKVPPVALDNCWIAQADGFADMFVTSNPDVFYLATGGSEAVLFSTNNLAGSPQTKPAGSANGFTISGRIAGDRANPDRLWAVSGAPYGNSTAQYTEDGYQTAQWFRVVDVDAHPFPSNGPSDVAFAGGTVLSAGNGGYVLTSVNGRDFSWNGGDGPLATTDWRSVALASAAQGAVGGVGGKLMVTTQANGTPVTPGPGPIGVPGPIANPIPPAPTKTVGFSFTGKGNSLSAKIVGRKVRVRMRGAVKPPKGVSLAAACSGKIKLTLKAKRKKLATRTVKLKPKKGKCRFAKTVLVKRAKIGGATSLRLTVRFQGNRVLKAGQKRYTLLVTR